VWQDRLETMLLDDLMPRYDVVERHRTLVRAAPEAVFAAIRDADLGGGLLTRALLALRMFPAGVLAFIGSPAEAWAGLRARLRAGGKRVHFSDFERTGFRVVAERAPEEIVIGLLGRFWTLRGGLRMSVSERDFRTGPPAGMALAGWNFTVISQGPGVCELATETRVWCAADARTTFRLYWLLVRPGSGLIRRAMLRSIQRLAERQSP
jgi:hypothetical protein